MSSGRRQRGTSNKRKQVTENVLETDTETLNLNEDTNEQEETLAKERETFEEYKKGIPIISVIHASTLEKALKLVAYTFILLYAFQACYDIYYMIAYNGFDGLIRFFIMNVLVILVTVIVFLRKKNLNWVILDLIIIIILN